MANAPSFEVDFHTRVVWEHIVGDSERLLSALDRHHLARSSFQPVQSEWLRAEFDDFHRFYTVRLPYLVWQEESQHMSALPLYIWAEEGTVLSYSPDWIEPIEQARKRLSDNPGWVVSSSRLIYYLLDELFGALFPFLDNLNDQIGALEEGIFQHRRRAHLERKIFQVKREVLKARRAMASVRDAVSQLVRHWTVHQQHDPFYYMELYDHMIRHFDTVDTYRELVNSVMDLHLSTVSNRLNEIVKTLTLVTTVLLPASLMAALYGMNFDYLPLIHYRFGFFVVLGVIGAISAAVYAFFRHRRWI